MPVFVKVCWSVVVLAVALGLGSWRATAMAQQAGDAKLAAEALFNEGRQLMQAGRYAEACDKFAASNAIDESVGALLNLGECLTRVGRMASAWGALRQATALAQRQGDRKRAALAEKRARALERKLSYLIIETAAGAQVAGLVIERDGSQVPEALWNQRLPVDPGSYAITASAPGRQSWATRIEVKARDAGGGAEMRVPVPALAVAAALPGPRAAEPPESRAAEPPKSRAAEPPEPTRPLETEPVKGPARDEGEDGMGTGRKLAIASGALGVAGIAAGVAFALRSQSKNDEAFDGGHCDENNQCTPFGIRLIHEAERSGLLANVSYGVGAVAVTTGVALWLLGAPGGEDEPGGTHTDARIRAAFGPGVAAIEMVGRF